jgi:NitT/TauT family transport system permease protein
MEVVVKTDTKLLLLRLLLIFAGLGFIEASVRLNWIDRFFLASPLQAVEVLWAQLVGGNALYLILVTLYEIAAALLIATVVGLLVGFILWRYRLIGASYETLLAALFASPVILAYPIFLVIFGRTSAAVIILSSFFGAVPIILNTRSAFQQVNPIFLQVGASMNLNRQRMFRHILLPAAAPAIFGGFRLGLTYILKSVLGLEYVVQVGGVGMWLSEAAFRFEVGEVYAGLVGTTLLSMLFLFMINRGEGWVRK